MNDPRKPGTGDENNDDGEFDALFTDEEDPDDQDEDEEDKKPKE